MLGYSVNLQTHVLFGAMVAALFTGRLDVILIVAVGSLIPDIDREYWFISAQRFKDEQYHRSLLHNIFVLFGLFLVNSWLSLGAFLHTLLDALTTEEDRGVEWLFPVTRWVKRGRYAYASQASDSGCTIQLVDQDLGDKAKTYFLNEDSIEFTKLSDPDLSEPKPVPWRRTYGPAKNGGILDSSIFVGSLLVLVEYAYLHSTALASQLGEIASGALNPLWALFGSIVLLYGSGYLKKVKLLSQVLLALGLFSLAASAYLAIQVVQNYVWPLGIVDIGSAILTLTLVTAAVWKIRTRNSRKTVV